MYAVDLARKLVVTLTTAAVVFGSAASAGCERFRSEERAAPEGAPAALLSATLTDQDGKVRAFAEFRGKIVVFSLFFTSCPTICPRETKALAEVQRQLAPGVRDRVQLVSLSVDPENDTPEAMRKFALENGAELGGWSFVRASEPATRALARELTIFEGASKTEAAPASHTTAAYLFDPTGRLRQRYAGNPLDVPRLAREIERLDAWVSSTSASGRKASEFESVTALK